MHQHRLFLDSQFAPNWFVMNKFPDKLDNVEFCNDGIDLPDIDSHFATFFSDEVSVITMNFNNINLDDNNFDEEDPETIIHVRLIAWCNRYNQARCITK